jgi:hypothetical protein
MSETSQELPPLRLSGFRFFGRPGQSTHLHWQTYNGKDAWPVDVSERPPGATAEEWQALRSVQTSLRRHRQAKGTQMFSTLVEDAGTPRLWVFDLNEGPHSNLDAVVRMALPNGESRAHVHAPYVLAELIFGTRKK